MKTRLILPLACAALLSGCATVQAPVTEFDSQAEYPAVGLVINDGYVHSEMVYTGYVATAVVDQTSRILRDELAATGVFASVQLNNLYAETMLSVSFSRTNTDGNIAKSVLAGGSLMIIPTTHKMKNVADIEVRVKAETIRVYHYEFLTNEMMFLGRDPYADEKQLGKALWSAFLADAQKDRLFDDLVPASLDRQRPAQASTPPESTASASPAEGS